MWQEADSDDEWSECTSCDSDEDYTRYRTAVAEQTKKDEERAGDILRKRSEKMDKRRQMAVNRIQAKISAAATSTGDVTAVACGEEDDDLASVADSDSHNYLGSPPQLGTAPTADQIYQAQQVSKKDLLKLNIAMVLKKGAKKEMGTIQEMKRNHKLMESLQTVPLPKIKNPNIDTGRADPQKSVTVGGAIHALIFMVRLKRRLNRLTEYEREIEHGKRVVAIRKKKQDVIANPTPGKTIRSMNLAVSRKEEELFKNLSAAVRESGLRARRAKLRGPERQDTEVSVMDPEGTNSFQGTLTSSATTKPSSLAASPTKAEAGPGFVSTLPPVPGIPSPTSAASGRVSTRADGTYLTMNNKTGLILQPKAPADEGAVCESSSRLRRLSEGNRQGSDADLGSKQQQPSVQLKEAQVADQNLSQYLFSEGSQRGIAPGPRPPSQKERRQQQSSRGNSRGGNSIGDSRLGSRGGMNSPPSTFVPPIAKTQNIFTLNPDWKDEPFIPVEERTHSLQTYTSQSKKSKLFEFTRMKIPTSLPEIVPRSGQGQGGSHHNIGTQPPTTGAATVAVAGSQSARGPGQPAAGAPTGAATARGLANKSSFRAGPPVDSNPNNRRQRQKQPQKPPGTADSVSSLGQDVTPKSQGSVATDLGAIVKFNTLPPSSASNLEHRPSLDSEDLSNNVKAARDTFITAAKQAAAEKDAPVPSTKVKGQFKTAVAGVTTSLFNFGRWKNEQMVAQHKSEVNDMSPDEKRQADRQARFRATALKMIATDTDAQASDTSSNAAHGGLVESSGSGNTDSKTADLRDPIFLESREAGKNFEQFLLHKQNEHSNFIERSIEELSRLHTASENFVLPKKRIAIRGQSDAGKGFIECSQKAQRSLHKDIAAHHGSNNLSYTEAWFNRLRRQVVDAMEPPFNEVDLVFGKFFPIFEQAKLAVANYWSVVDSFEKDHLSSLNLQFLLLRFCGPFKLTHVDIEKGLRARGVRLLIPSAAEEEERKRTAMMNARDAARHRDMKRIEEIQRTNQVYYKTFQEGEAKAQLAINAVREERKAKKAHIRAKTLETAFGVPSTGSILKGSMIKSNMLKSMSMSKMSRSMKPPQDGEAKA